MQVTLPTFARDSQAFLRRRGVRAALFGMPWRGGAWRPDERALCLHVRRKLDPAALHPRQRLRPYGDYALDVLEAGDPACQAPLAGLAVAPDAAGEPARFSTVTAAFRLPGEQRLLLSGHGALAFVGGALERRWASPVAVTVGGRVGVTDAGALDGTGDWCTARFEGAPFPLGHPLAGPPPLVLRAEARVEVGDTVRLRSAVRDRELEGVVRGVGDAQARLPDGQILLYRGVFFVTTMSGEAFSVARDSGALVVDDAPTPRAVGTVVAGTSGALPGTYVLPASRLAAALGGAFFME